MNPRFVIACDKFKGSLTATEVAETIAAGLQDGGPAAVDSVLVADGGDGTIVAVLSAGFEEYHTEAAGPTGEIGDVRYAGQDDVMVVELAEACGMERLPGGELAPLTASSLGLGQVIAAALEHEPRQLVIGVGGSASTDGGTGMLVGLGARLLDAEGNEVPAGAGSLKDIATLDLTNLHPGVDTTEIVLASDVLNPLLGSQGAVAIFGPQKGVTEELADEVEAGMANWADVVARAVGSDFRESAGAGSAGGVGFAAMAVLGAELRSGVQLILDLVRIDALIEGADLVITGEGSLDEQTLLGKTVMGVAERANAAGVPAVAVCGRLLLDEDQLRELGVKRAYALAQIEPDPRKSMSNAGPLLHGVARDIRQNWKDLT